MHPQSPEEIASIGGLETRLCIQGELNAEGKVLLAGVVQCTNCASHTHHTAETNGPFFPSRLRVQDHK